LRTAVEPVNASEEPELQAIIESFQRVIDVVQSIARPEVIEINALFKVNWKVMTQKPAMLFSSAMDKDTKKKYCRFWEQVLCYIYQIQKNESYTEDKPGYQFTRTQKSVFNALVTAVDDLTDRTDRTDRTERTEKEDSSESPKKKDPVLEQIDWLCLEFCIILLNHELEDNEYKSVVISALAVLRFQEDRG
jgi:hypothetical protein